MDAVTAIHTTMNRKECSQWVLDADISGCFYNINHGPLLAKLPVVTTTLRQWLKAGVVEVGFFSPTDTGTPQGGVISHRRQDKLYIIENEGILHAVTIFPCAYRRSVSCSCP